MNNAPEIAEISKNQIAVMPTEREDNGTKWLKVSVPNGWDDCKKLVKKVLVYKGETYVWRSWNSDSLVANFIQSNEVARVK